MDDAFAPVQIAGGGLRATLVRHGARLADLRVDGRPLVLGYADPRDHLRHAALHAGAVIGRVAGGIAGGRAVLDGRALRLPVNAPPHHVHGGPDGFSLRRWRLEERTAHRAAFATDSPDGEGGYPGRVAVRAVYEAGPGTALALTLEARTTAPTFLNLCHHPYWSLDGAGDVGGHRLRIEADRYLPCDGDVLPTGEVAAVEGTPFDFRVPRALGVMPPPGANNTFCLHDRPAGPLRRAARLEAGGRALEVWTTQPGLHLYDGYRILDHGGGLDGRRHGRRAGLCLEAQGWPDSPNNPGFPSAVLRPGEAYRQVTVYRLA